MIEMKYYNKILEKPIILYTNKYKDYIYYIINYGTHPCCYVYLSKGHKYFGKHYDDIDINCHGGLTFSYNQLHDIMPSEKNYWIIGWDYAHYGDYVGLCKELAGHKYTTEELIKDCQDVIDQLIQANKPKAIICDLDGTLFDCQWRRKYLPDYDTFNKNHIYDNVNKPILEIVKKFSKDCQIIFVSGRNVKYAESTKEQINEYFNKKYKIFMRGENDFQADENLKKEMYDKFIKNCYDVLFVIDDRSKNVKMWRNLGLTCLQVDYGDF